MLDKRSFYYQKLELQQQLAMKEKDLGKSFDSLLNPATYLSLPLLKAIIGLKAGISEGQYFFRKLFNGKSNAKTSGGKSGFLKTFLQTIALLRGFRETFETAREIYQRMMKNKETAHETD